MPLFAPHPHPSQASTRNESAAFMLVAQMMRVILTPRQYTSVSPAGVLCCFGVQFRGPVLLLELCRIRVCSGRVQ
jgi:hypothetical protein